MDIKRGKPQSAAKYQSIIIGTVLLTMAIVASSYTFTRSDLPKVERATLLIDTVQQGELHITVRGSGTLVPKNIRWIATNSHGRVDRILIKAGAQVKTGDLLFELSNPQLKQQLDEAKWDLAALSAETRAQQVAFETQLLDQEAAVISAKLNYQSAQLTLKAQQSLFDQGVVAVSQIAHAEVKITVEQLFERWQLEIKRLNKQKENLAAQRQASLARLKRLQHSVHQLEQQVAALNIKSTMDSIVQEMPLILGQQVSAGSNLARLAGNETYLAELKIPEKLIKDVIIGQAVVVDTRNNKIDGVVQRIDPTVINGTVQVDIELTSELPAEARPDLTVEGIIEIAHFTDTLYVKRPMFSQAQSEKAVFIVNAEHDSAMQAKVSFGQMSSQYIQILSGLTIGQQIIVSDTSSWQQYQQITVN
jgi:HlyD family secretion protein